MARTEPVQKEHWKIEPDEHDYPAAANYLSLLMDDLSVTRTVNALKSVAIEHRLAKGLLRASRLVHLPFDNAHVAADLKKVRKGKKLSPVLLVRGSFSNDVALTLAMDTTESVPVITLTKTPVFPADCATHLSERYGGEPGTACDQRAPTRETVTAIEFVKRFPSAPPTALGRSCNWLFGSGPLGASEVQSQVSGLCAS
jgi:hypothetical protein